MTGFSGSYAAKDVTFLMKEVTVSSTAIDDKERHIKQGGHYSEMLTLENAPSAEYMNLYRDALARNRSRFATDVLQLARRIDEHRAGEIVVVSLARAGTPVGVLVTRALKQILGRQATHYCVSIIRDRGLDLNAIRHIVARHRDTGIVFVDGWTGKGVIGRELTQSVEALNRATGWHISPALYVVADISGTADVAATHDDYLLPSAVLNSTISGLVSRTVLTPDIGPEDFHGCVRYGHLAAHDVSREFVDDVFSEMAGLPLPDDTWRPSSKATVRAGALEVLARYRRAFSIDDDNLIKPGIGEATRVMLRRRPRLLVLRDMDSPESLHLRFLADRHQVPLMGDPLLTCHALALIDQAD